MKKTCYTCNFYGKCAVQVKSCNDWKEWDNETVVLNLEAFNGLWIGLHKKWYERYPQELYDERMKTISLYLAGETEKQITERLSSSISEEIIKELEEYEKQNPEG